MIKRCFVVSMFFCSSVHAMVFDNRFLPLYYKPHTRRCDALSWIRIQPFFMRADRAFSDDRHANIPDIDGSYDQVTLAHALVAVGSENPLRSDFRLKTTLPWSRRGRIDAQGLALYYEQAFCPWLSVGIGTFYGSVNARHDFSLRATELAALSEGDRNYLFQVKEQMHRELGVLPAFYKKTGFGDTDLYVRLGMTFDYTLKCRRLDPAFKVGLIIPTASSTACNNPAAVPLGGQGHWGIYSALEFENECKEDLIVGFNFRAIKRFTRTRQAHLPVAGEPSSYGAVVGPLAVNPGWTFVANPYISFEGLREGFGLKAQYTVVAHLRDLMRDGRVAEEQKKNPVSLDSLQCRSSWAMEHVTIGAFYDFGKVRECPSLYPKLSAYWDIPVNWLVSKRAAKTSSVSLMVEFDF